jgi:hypothetical protein
VYHSVFDSLISTGAALAADGIASAQVEPQAGQPKAEQPDAKTAKAADEKAAGDAGSAVEPSSTATASQIAFELALVHCTTLHHYYTNGGSGAISQWREDPPLASCQESRFC